MAADEQHPGTDDPTSAIRHGGIPHYEIHVRGRLSPGWDAWFDGMVVTTGPEGSSVIRGPVVDQSALHGLLRKLSDVGLVLESLTRVPPAHGAAGPRGPLSTNHHDTVNPTGEKP